MKAITSGKADIACGVAFDWGRAEKVSYIIPFAIGGTHLLTKTTINGMPSSLRGRTVVDAFPDAPSIDVNAPNS